MCQRSDVGRSLCNWWGQKCPCKNTPSRELTPQISTGNRKASTVEVIYSSKSGAPPLPKLAKLGAALLDGHGHRKTKIEPEVCTTLRAGGRERGSGLGRINHFYGTLWGAIPPYTTDETRPIQASVKLRRFPQCFKTSGCWMFPLLLSPDWPVGGVIQVERNNMHFLCSLAPPRGTSCWLACHAWSGAGKLLWQSRS